MSTNVVEGAQLIVSAANDQYVFSRHRDMEAIALCGNLIRAADTEPLFVKDALRLESKDIHAAVEMARQRWLQVSRGYCVLLSHVAILLRLQDRDGLVIRR